MVTRGLQKTNSVFALGAKVQYLVIQYVHTCACERDLCVVCMHVCTHIYVCERVCVCVIPEKTFL